jgi:hypothetical protein
MKLTIEITCDNAAFDDNGIVTETMKCLDRVKADLEKGTWAGNTVQDTNGNTVGYWRFFE